MIDMNKSSLKYHKLAYEGILRRYVTAPLITKYKLSKAFTRIVSRVHFSKDDLTIITIQHDFRTNIFDIYIHNSYISSIIFDKYSGENHNDYIKFTINWNTSTKSYTIELINSLVESILGKD